MSVVRLILAAAGADSLPESLISCLPTCALLGPSDSRNLAMKSRTGTITLFPLFTRANYKVVCLCPLRQLPSGLILYFRWITMSEGPSSFYASANNAPLGIEDRGTECCSAIACLSSIHAQDVLQPNEAGCGAEICDMKLLKMK